MRRRTRAEAAPTAAEPAPTPAEPAPTPTEPPPTPAEPTPAEPAPTPTPTEPTPTPTEPTPTPTEPADTVRPSITLVSPAAGAVVSGTVTLRSLASDDVGVTGVEYSSGTTLLGPAVLEDGAWVLALDTTALPDGPLELVARAHDAAGNTEGGSTAVTVHNAPPPAPDTTAPRAAVVSPASGAVVSGVVVLRATASDDVGTTAVRFYAGSTLLGPGVLVDGSWTLGFDTRSRPNATYGVVAKAYDAAGNVGTSPVRYFTVRN